ncbi:MAG TPA: hypothetical protein VN783_07960 [Thermoanaerobaculia bacterium]|nr:hypothetical protein [Thermoanaerobaculia bacterium]
MKEDRGELALKPMPRRLKVALILTGIALAWSISTYVMVAAISRMGSVWGGQTPDLGALATLLFGSSSLLLVGLSILLAAAAFFGWEAMKKSIEASVSQRIAQLETALQGRAYAVIGLLIGTLHSKPERLEQDETDKEYLAEAVYYSKQGHELLRDLPGRGQYMALNNLVYYSCLLGRGLVPRHLLEQAKSLREVAQKQPEYAAPYLLTYCRVILQFEKTADAIQGALTIARDLLDEDLTELQRKEATFYVTSLAGKLERLTGAGTAGT